MRNGKRLTPHWGDDIVHSLEEHGVASSILALGTMNYENYNIAKEKEYAKKAEVLLRTNVYGRGLPEGKPGEIRKGFSFFEVYNKKNKDGEDVIFTLVDKIEGDSLSKIESLPLQVKDELEAHYLTLGQHYYDARKQGLRYLGDCRSDQFVYGI